MVRRIIQVVPEFEKIQLFFFARYAFAFTAFYRLEGGQNVAGVVLSPISLRFVVVYAFVGGQSRVYPGLGSFLKMVMDFRLDNFKIGVF